MFHSRRLIACLVAFLLVFAQQAAFAHLIGHAGATAQSQVQPDQDTGHDAALTLSHQCTTCLAFVALASPAPVATSPLLPVTVTTAAKTMQLRQAAPPRPAALAYLSRAPPL
jgi:UPF0716 family protein affecting phage T7 exclusion